jgi:hypothetical protein
MLGIDMHLGLSVADLQPTILDFFNSFGQKHGVFWKSVQEEFHNKI